jgi:exonuclease SbcC
MVPLKLRLRNFMSYGEDVPPLDFTEFDLACLSGQNGHGKSALLDAITWALWGEARKARGRTSPDDDILRIGANEVEVEFEFEVEDRRYRVLRKYSRKNRKRMLELHLFSQGRWLPLTGQSIRETQQKINSILHMDYETFVATSLILQGRADEFTRKTPAERKEILASILGLDHYDELSELARQRQKVRSDEAQFKERELNRIDEALKVLPELLKKKEELKEALANIESSLKAVADELNEKRSQLARLNELERQRQKMEEDRKRLKSDLNELNRTLKALYERYQELKKLIDRADEIESNCRRYQELQRRDEELTMILQKLSALEKEKRRLEQVIEGAKKELELKLAKLQEQRKACLKDIDEARRFTGRREEIERGYNELQSLRKDEAMLEELRKRYSQLYEHSLQLGNQIELERQKLEERLKAFSEQARELEAKASAVRRLEGEAKRLHEEVERLKGLREEADALRAKIGQCEGKLTELSVKCGQAKSEIEETSEKLRLLAQSKEPRCPLCKSPLDEHSKEMLEREFVEFVNERQRLIEELSKERKQLEQERTEAEARLKSVLKEVELLDSVQRELANVEARLSEARDAEEKLNEVVKVCDELKRRIEAGEFATELREQLKDIQEQLNALGYDENEHERVKREIERKREFEVLWEQLKQAEAKLAGAESQLRQVEDEIRKVQSRISSCDYAHEEQKRLREVEARISELGYDEEEHKRVREEKAKLEEYAKLSERLKQATEEEKSLKAQLGTQVRMFQDGRKKLEELEKSIKAVEDELSTKPKVEGRISELERKHKMLDEKRSQLQLEMGNVEGRIKECEELKQERSKVEEELKQLRYEEQLYGILARAFGRDGIQALIIENAIPEIERDANSILSKLTHGRAHVSFELQRETLGGSLRETLDIKIADELGTRPYELYSGGEGFRIDFAIRIALAKLLARRAGARLRFLVVDEGFGTQDSDGLRQMVEAIHSIRGEFDKIIVVTHLDQLKDAFPVRIEVTKLPDVGSRFEVIHL